MNEVSETQHTLKNVDIVAGLGHKQRQLSRWKFILLSPSSKSAFARDELPSTCFGLFKISYKGLSKCFISNTVKIRFCFVLDLLKLCRKWGKKVAGHPNIGH